jgi:hypothetical protein
MPSGVNMHPRLSVPSDEAKLGSRLHAFRVHMPGFGAVVLHDIHSIRTPASFRPHDCVGLGGSDGFPAPSAERS